MRIMKRSRFVLAASVWCALFLLPAVGGLTTTVAQTLGAIRTIFVAPVEAGSYSAAVGKRLAEELQRSGSLRVVSDPAEADAVLHASGYIWISGTVSPSVHSNSTREVNYQGDLSAELIGRDRQTLWSYMVTPGRFRTASITDNLADQLVARLVAAVRSGIPYPAPYSATAPASSVTIQAAGSTLPAPLYLKWFESYAQARAGVTILYDPVGSEAGIERLKDGKVDFAGSDIPVSALPASTASSILDIPTVLGGVVPVYNLSSLDGRTLNLTPKALAGIYSGAIRRWNDPTIRESNRGVHLPDADIDVIHRSDGSGTTYIWTSYLSSISPDWKSRYGAAPTVSWPVGDGVEGSDGVVEKVSSTPNSIGYVELIYAIQHQVSFAAVRNPAGQFIKASLESISDAVPSSLPTANDDRSILNAPGRNAYPISAFTWILMPRQSSDAARRQAILQFLQWMLTSGQKECEALGFVPLPRRVAARQLDLLTKLQ